MKNGLLSVRKFIIGALISFVVFLGMALFIFLMLFAVNDSDREIIVIPSYVGQELAKIQQTKSIKIESELIFSDTVPEGTVISQIPLGGSEKKVKKDGYYTVKLIVSLGKERFEIPDLINAHVTDAAADLRSVGARVRVISIYDKNAECDRVISTSPARGEKICAGDKVTLFVCRKKTQSSVKVENYVGMKLSDACAAILSSGLLIGDIECVECDGLDEGLVTFQSINQGAWVRHGSYITLYVAKDKGDNKEQNHPFRGNVKL